MVVATRSAGARPHYAGRPWSSKSRPTVRWVSARSCAIALQGAQRMMGSRLSIMKNPTRDERHQACARKRRYRTQGDALDAAMVAGVERQRSAYPCTLCGHWHLTSR